MVLRDRERLLFSAALAVIVHGVLGLGLHFADFSPEPFPDSLPVTVTLPDLASPVLPVEEEPDPQAEDAPPEEIQAPEPDPPEQIASQTEPVPPDPTPAEPPAPQPAPQAEPVSRDAPPGSFDISGDPMLRAATNDEAGAPPRGGQIPDSELFGRPETVEEPGVPRPQWLIDGEIIQPLDTLSEQDQVALAGVSDRVRDLLDDVVAALQAGTATAASPDAADPSTGPGAATTGPATTTLPGGETVTWGSGEGRTHVSANRPQFTASDFGGLVPSRIVVVVVFDVDENGTVISGSLIVRSGSGYTLADQKIRAAVQSWRFERAEGAEDVTAIAQIVIARDDL